MVEQFFKCLTTPQCFRAGPLGPHIDTFVAVLLERGYVRTGIKDRIRLIASLSQWLHRQQIDIKELDEHKIKKFLQYRWKRYSIQTRDRSTLQLLLNYLRDCGIISPLILEVDNSVIAQLERNFIQYLRQERKLSQGTIKNILFFVHKFLTKYFGKKDILLSKLCPRGITNFILYYTKGLHPGRIKIMASALRSFLRFLYLRGDINTDFTTLIPPVANWSHATLPKYISQKQVKHLLQSCNQNTPIGLRDYAILLLVTRFGLRGCEITHMTLDDIDWEAGELTIHGKGSQEDKFPIPKDVGNALAAYLRYVRPHCTTRRVFVRMHAPRCEFITPGTVYKIIQGAFNRAGIQAPHKGASILRHSLATELLRKGASLAEIGEILRHRFLRTTEIYAKVDLVALHSLAQPWPGGKV